MATRIVNMTIPSELLTQADAVARAEGRKRSELVREALRQYIAARSPNGRSASTILSRLAALATKGPDMASSEIDRRLYGRTRSR